MELVEPPEVQGPEVDGLDAVAHLLESDVASSEEAGDEDLAAVPADGGILGNAAELESGRLGTYQDLVSSGNIRLLDPELRRRVVEYHVQLESNARTMSRFSSGKPRFADLVPGRAKQGFAGRCWGDIRGAESDCGGQEAEAVYATLPAGEREAPRLLAGVF